MNFPLEQPVFRFLYWLVNTPGIGAAVVGLLILAALGFFLRTLRWITAARQVQQEALPYPSEH